MTIVFKRKDDTFGLTVTEIKDLQKEIDMEREY